MRSNSQSNNVWEKKHLEELVVRMSNGTTENQVDKVTPYPVTRIETISDGKINPSRVKYLESPSDVEKYRLRKGDILFSHINSIEHIGKTAIYEDKPDLLLHGMNLLLLRPNLSIIDYQFFFQYLNWEKTRNKFKSLAKKAVNQASINTTELGSVVLPVPSLVEQHGIAEVLSTVDEAIKRTNAVIEKTEELKRGLMQRLLTKGIEHTEFKHTELGEIPKAWDVIKIGALTKVTNGSTPKRTIPEYWEKGTIPWITTTQVNDKYITKAEQYITQTGFQNSSLKILPKNTVLVSMIGQGKNRGKAALLMLDGATTNQNFAAIPPSLKLDPYFLLFYLENNYQQIRALGRGSNQDALNCKIIQSIKIPVPGIIEQKKISSIIIGCEIKIANEQSQNENLKVINNGLMQILLSGRVRVRLDEGGLHRIRDS